MHYTKNRYTIMKKFGRSKAFKIFPALFSPGLFQFLYLHQYYRMRSPNMYLQNFRVGQFLRYILGLSVYKMNIKIETD